MIERFKNFVSSLSMDEDFDIFYQEAVDKVGQPVSRADRKHDYRQLYFEIIDSIVGMLNEGFQNMKQFEFLDLVNPKVFSTWNGVIEYEINRRATQHCNMSPYFYAVYWPE